jgi:hypothetical protein
MAFFLSEVGEIKEIIELVFIRHFNNNFISSMDKASIIKPPGRASLHQSAGKLRPKLRR